MPRLAPDHPDAAKTHLKGLSVEPLHLLLTGTPSASQHAGETPASEEPLGATNVPSEILAGFLPPVTVAQRVELNYRWRRKAAEVGDLDRAVSKNAPRVLDGAPTAGAG